MFDPVNNPFAIQNLLAREQDKEDTAFLPDADGRPDAAYGSNALLQASAMLPPRDFASDGLLSQPQASGHDFLAEYDDDEIDDGRQDDAYAYADAAADADDGEPEPEPPLTLAMLAAQLAEEAAGADKSSPATDMNTPLAGSAATDTGAPADQLSSAEHSASATATDGAPAQSVPQALADDIDGRDVPLTQDAQPPLPADEHAPAAVPAVSDEAGAAAVAASVREEVSVEAGDVIASDDNDFAAAAATADDTAPDTGSQPDASLVAASEAATESATDPAASAAGDTETTLVAAQEPVPDVPAGLSQDAVDQLLEAAREEVRNEAREQGREQGRQEAREAAYEEGLQAGIAQATAELQQRVEQKTAQLARMIESLQQLSDNPDALFEPMKKLAVHLAEQLVRGELAQSPQTISRLVDNCLRELAASGEKAVIIHLNPEDLEQYKPLAVPYGDSLMLRPDALLSRGSVRASLDGSVVEDLIERRVKGISQSLAQPVAAGWRPALANPLTRRAPPEPTKAAAPSVATAIDEATDDAGSAEVFDEDPADVAGHSEHEYTAALTGEAEAPEMAGDRGEQGIATEDGHNTLS